ncbi:hypothetical protein LCGC14_0112500 [marine sediment metagenome]|uniref:Uncharacterized protein n=1 Tax=marine sediment metagenome TaxID=412755 RepID=A0A0F9VCZ1_9ZZZZ
MNYWDIAAALLNLLFSSIIRLSGDQAYAVLVSFTFAMTCVSLYLIANTAIMLLYGFRDLRTER